MSIILQRFVVWSSYISFCLYDNSACFRLCLVGLCSACFAERERTELESMFVYENAVIYICKVDHVDETIVHNSGGSTTNGLGAFHAVTDGNGVKSDEADENGGLVLECEDDTPPVGAASCSYLLL